MPIIIKSKVHIFGRTPLSWVDVHGYKMVVQRLLDQGAHTDSKENSGKTPLFWASVNKHDRVVMLSLENQFITINDGSDLWKIVVGDSCKHIVELLVANYQGKVAQRNFTWLLDLRDACLSSQTSFLCH
jgi:ankyrin repeat protein